MLVCRREGRGGGGEVGREMGGGEGGGEGGGGRGGRGRGGRGGGKSSVLCIGVGD